MSVRFHPVSARLDAMRLDSGGQADLCFDGSKRKVAHMVTPSSPRHAPAMTLLEVIIALSILALSLGGILAALIQSRRLTEGSVVQNSAVTIVQGYVEQMKNMDLPVLINADGNGNAQLGASYSIPTLLDQATTDPLATSTGTPPALSSLTPGVTPSGLGIVDNLKSIPAQSVTAGPSVTWSTAWPGAQNYPTGTAGRNDLHLNLWVWISDLTGTTAGSKPMYGITVIYTWQYQNGARTSYIMGTVRAIRSLVPTF
jgi:type II secretory pathway pseudopilin PulG